MRSTLPLRLRLIVLGLNLAVGYGVAGLLAHVWLPGGGGESIWIYAGLAFWFFRFTDPHFIPPSDSLAACVSGAVALVTFDLSSVAHAGAELSAFRWTAAGVLTVGAVAAAVAMTQGQTGASASGSSVGRFAFRIADRLGQPEIVFVAPILVSIVGFYQNTPVLQAWLLLFWTLILLVQPIEFLVQLVADLVALFRLDVRDDAVGEIQRIDDPGILRVKLKRSNSWKPSEIHIACLADERQVEVIPLFVQVQDLELVGTGLTHGLTPAKVAKARIGSVYRSSACRTADTLVEELSGGTKGKLVGFVVEDSEISLLRFELAAHTILEEGSLVFVTSQSGAVYYQVVDARTAEETFSQNPRGTHLATAIQLGCYAKCAFRRYGWLPAMNAPVFLAIATAHEAEASDGDSWRIGTIPKTNMPVIVRLSHMLEFHTAILGVTGTGKTEMAFSLIREAAIKGYKIVCVDLTQEYAARLSDLNPVKLDLKPEIMSEFDSLLFGVETGEFSAGKEKAALQEFVAKNALPIQRKVKDFLEGEDSNLAIIGLEEIANTRATLRTTELFLSAVFKWAKDSGVKNKVVVVLEEAHTIVPESALFRNDRVETDAVLGRMSQIALQGRKYGVGLVLISQRTALVSKTLLSQCNTVLAFGMHDETGLNYLRNVFDSQYVSALTKLKFLQGIGFGKALLSDRPIIFEVKFDSETDAMKAARKNAPWLVNAFHFKVDGVEDHMVTGISAFDIVNVGDLDGDGAPDFRTSDPIQITIPVSECGRYLALGDDPTVEHIFKICWLDDMHIPFLTFRGTINIAGWGPSDPFNPDGTVNVRITRGDVAMMSDTTCSMGGTISAG